VVEQIVARRDLLEHRAHVRALLGAALGGRVGDLLFDVRLVHRRKVAVVRSTGKRDAGLRSAARVASYPLAPEHAPRCRARPRRP
jgi:hypothetical protein